MLSRTALVLASLSLFACGSKPGTLQVSIYGEEFIEEGIPSDVFSDGWKLNFSKFLVSLGDVSAANEHTAPALTDSTYRIFDLTRPSSGMGHSVLSGEVPGGAYDHIGYRIAPPPTGAKLGNATAADLDRLRQGGFGLYVEGSAQKGTVTKTIRWGFTGKTAYGGCHSTAVIDGGPAKSQITIHADHLLYDDLFSSEPNVSFDLIASADTNTDGEVTSAELAAVDISTQARYQVGSTGVRDLWSFITYQTSTVGHIDGEGHCETATRQ